MCRKLLCLSMAVRGSITWTYNSLIEDVHDGEEEEEDEDQVAEELHPDDGVDEEEHPHEHADVGKRLKISPPL